MPEKVEDSKFEALLDHVKRTRGFDFTGYKRSSLIRRVEKRMHEVGIKNFLDYMDYLEVHQKEFDSLFNTILINVTSFFRDTESWQYMADHCLPKIVLRNGSDGWIRVWSAGCASGEEAYSIAILLCEALGVDQFQQRVKIYATDLDEEALNLARQASYTAEALEAVDPALKERYFLQSGDRFAFRPDLRRSVIFGRHDLLQDAPISHLDLLICRNTLMYLNSETQRKILSRFHFALKDDGFLYLGKAEMLLTHASLFQQVDLKHRIFSKVPRLPMHDTLIAMPHAGDHNETELAGVHTLMRELSMDAAPVAQVLIDTTGNVISINASARRLFGLLASDLGRPLRDLEMSYRPIDLRSLIDQAVAEKGPVRVDKVERHQPDRPVQLLDVEVIPLANNLDSDFGVAIQFTDVSHFQKLYDELERANQELETTNEELQSAHEELETTNEELQSTNEELETTNEELQSTNEELETMNEELQSTNEELETTNNEQRTLTAELNQSNAFLGSILSSVQSAVVVLDPSGNIVAWNHGAEDLWGLRSNEVQGANFLGLDIGLPVKELAAPIQKFRLGGVDFDELLLNARNRRGRSIKCKIRISPLSADKDNNRGMVLLMDEVQK